jgi:hypothetical protein
MDEVVYVSVLPQGPAAPLPYALASWIGASFDRRFFHRGTS